MSQTNLENIKSKLTTKQNFEKNYFIYFLRTGGKSHFTLLPVFIDSEPVRRTNKQRKTASL